MASHRNRRFSFDILEGRRLLTTALWLGQDGHDFAGGPSAGVGNGVQDIHIELQGLPAGKTISGLEVDGYGGGGWLVNSGPYATYDGDLFQTAGSTTADLYVDPEQVETGRPFTVTLNYSDGSSEQITMNGGTADPNLPMPADVLSATWDGQDGRDLTGASPSVGPEGIQDVHLVLKQLNGSLPVSAVTVTSQPSGEGWSFGLNPNRLANAEFVANAIDPNQGDLYFSPDRDLSGQTLTVTVTYGDGKLVTTTLSAGHTDLALTMPPPALVAVNWGTLGANWVGQDGLNLIGPGDVDVAIHGIPAGRSVEAATLSDEAGFDWSFVAPASSLGAVDPNAQPLGFQLTTAARGDASVTFPPVRDETGATLTLVVTLDDGELVATRFAGGAADPGLRAPEPAATTVIVHPGDDLNALANAYGTVHLSAGTYAMTQPLVLNQPVDLVADPGVVLLFTQGPTAAAWTAAIKVMASHTTLDGFAVRFAGPVRWNQQVSYGASVIGTTDDYDAWTPDPRIDETLTHLDLEAPPASTSWEEAAQLIRMTNAESGAIADNTLRGGVSVVFNGPWQITGNAYLGTLAKTYANGAFVGHQTHDVTIAHNLIAPMAGSGKTWRFLVMTQEGIGDSVVDNIVSGIGPMDSDTVPNPNAPETILTEAYSLHYEGSIASVSPSGMVVQIPEPQNGPARTGDVLSILSGPQAGQWFMIAQVINANTYVLDAPIAPGTFAVSISTGFVNETYQGNSIDARGSSTAKDLVLAGNQFGAKIIDNTFLGGGSAFELTAYATEHPGIWGWSHTPFLGAAIEGNTIEDTVNGGLIDVVHSAYTKSSAGRVYFSASFVENTGIWDAAFLATRSAQAAPTMLTLGDSLSADPGELVLTTSRNLVSGPASVGATATIQVVSGTLNGQSDHNVGVILPLKVSAVVVRLGIVKAAAAPPPPAVRSMAAVALATSVASRPTTIVMSVAIPVAPVIHPVAAHAAQHHPARNRPMPKFHRNVVPVAAKRLNPTESVRGYLARPRVAPLRRFGHGREAQFGGRLP